MKSKIIFSTAIVATIALTACNSSQTNQEKTGEATIHQHEHAPDKEEAAYDQTSGATMENETAEEEKIMLNEGERWEVNAEMIPHLQASEKVLASYQEKNDADYLELATQLQAENKKLIASCTMKGESHEQLHHWLHPHLELVKALEEADSQKKADKVVADLAASFEKYHAYFK